MKLCAHRAAELLPEYILGNLEPKTAEMIEKHVKTCDSCSLEMHLLRKLEEAEVAEPDPWFYESLPKRVTAEAGKRRKKRKLFLVPAWAGGAAAILLALMLFRTGPEAPLKIETLENEYLQDSNPVALGFGEEISSASAPTVLRDLDQVFVNDLENEAFEAVFAENNAFDSEGYETLDVKTIRVFENLIEDMTPKKAREKVMS